MYNIQYFKERIEKSSHDILEKVYSNDNAVIIFCEKPNFDKHNGDQVGFLIYAKPETYQDKYRKKVGLKYVEEQLLLIGSKNEDSYPKLYVGNINNITFLDEVVVEEKPMTKEPEKKVENNVEEKTNYKMKQLGGAWYNKSGGLTIKAKILPTKNDLVLFKNNRKRQNSKDPDFILWENN